MNRNCLVKHIDELTIYMYEQEIDILNVNERLHSDSPTDRISI